MIIHVANLKYLDESFVAGAVLYSYIFSCQTTPLPL